ncbi:hypothetical protein LSH36_321g00002 [Paralvinella palmiformis]|uniref:Uncharacterized protein n=1 Tax=Paralvinella palmiformis TaxID=53620 RepID=A0AAD9N0X8_9ANNE|nr:hypothetical protein LSH36_321g00002 [Paralvinella palmiformis]
MWVLFCCKELTESDSGPDFQPIFNTLCFPLTNPSFFNGDLPLIAIFMSVSNLLCGKQGRPILICTDGDTETATYAYKHIEVPHMVDALQGIITVLPMQLLSYHIAVLRGYDVRIHPPTFFR